MTKWRIVLTGNDYIYIYINDKIKIRKCIYCEIDFFFTNPNFRFL